MLSRLMAATKKEFLLFIFVVSTTCLEPLCMQLEYDTLKINTHSMRWHTQKKCLLKTHFCVLGVVSNKEFFRSRFENE